jgi:peptidoglycan/xylan/chitin deacetylase (PgdA/CDA1 family)
VNVLSNPEVTGREAAPLRDGEGIAAELGWRGAGGPVHDRKARRKRALARWGAGTLGFAAGAAGLWALFGPAGGLVGLAALGLWLFLADRSMRQEGGVPVLIYHSVSSDAAWLPWAKDISVRPETFDRHLRTLRAMGRRFLDTRELVALRRAGRVVPPGSVVIHLDDGYRDNWIAAAPILARHGACATLFASLDFVDPTPGLRPRLGSATPPRWDGYCSWDELRALDAEGCVDVQPHGVDHGRVETGPEPVAVLTAANWRSLAWVQWAASPGQKHDWYRTSRPVTRGLGTVVRQNGAALAARAWTEAGGLESWDSYRDRVEAQLRRCREVFRRELGKTPEVFCWPENECSALAREVALSVGFAATTGGRGENRPEEDPTVISRVHVGDRIAGFDWPWAEGVALRAVVRTFEGNLYWYFLLLLFAVSRKAATGVRACLPPDRSVRRVPQPS